MDAFDAYSMFRAMQLYFEGDFDYFKYNGKARVTQESFMTNKSKYCFYKLVRKYNDMESFFLANFVYGDVKWIGDLMTDKAHKNYVKWLGNNNAISHIFKAELAMILDHAGPNVFQVKDGQNPPLLTMLYRGDVTMETILILDAIYQPTGIINDWYEKIIDPILWPKMHKKMVKYMPWIKKLDISKFNKIFRDTMHERSEVLKNEKIDKSEFQMLEVQFHLANETRASRVS